MKLADLTDELTYSIPSGGDVDRLRELVKYVARKCENDPAFGRVMLNKILYHADFRAFFDSGKPVTGEKYQHLEFGPAAVAMKPVLNKLAASGEIIEREPDINGYQKIFAVTEPNLEIFTGREISYIDAEIERLRGKSADTVSKESHDIRWKITKMHDRIPYEAVFLEEPELTAGDIQRAIELDDEHGWGLF